jgi:heptaprenylglyceryl phosphate synthase
MAVYLSRCWKIVNKNCYNPKYLINTAVEDLVDFAELGLQPLTKRQIISKAYLVLNKTQHVSRLQSTSGTGNQKPIKLGTTSKSTSKFREPILFNK